MHDILTDKQMKCIDLAMPYYIIDLPVLHYLLVLAYIVYTCIIKGLVHF